MNIRHAMDAADLEELDAAAQEIGAAAVHTALSLQDGRAEMEARLRAEAEAQKQRDLDTALAETVDLVARHRARLGRKTCSVHDGAAIRKIYDLLRGLFPAGLEGTDE